MKGMLSSNKLRFISVAILCVIIGVLAVLGVGAKKASHVEESTSVEFYYMNLDNSGMRSETKQIPNATEEEIIFAVLNELKAGSKKENFVASVPADVEFLSLTMQDELVTVDVSSAYAEMSLGAEMVCRASIVWTLTSLPFVNDVVISIEGKPLAKTDGTAIGNMNRENVLIDTVVSPETKRYEEFELYFANEDSTALIAEKRDIEVSQNQPKERSIVEQLIAGPNDKNHHETMPAETKLRDITTTDDGICYVNFSVEFVNKKNVGSEALTIYSVVNSLAGITYIDKVQFLIEGEKLEKYKETIDISKPLEARPSLIK